ncbi:lipopolysaccharide biosynthesis protein [Polaribacter tangerinus]|uniref:lipopolysaccharide biosynthesis protein n=1 Tax=Polaribacter tangerinus TaxID=1920034 RepID=UPI001303E13F|nr:oligosaccharide flippase family protein [Polaribacter tangerinus]
MNKINIFKGGFKKDLSIYFVGNLVNASIPFLLLPILTRILSQEEYGEVTMFLLLVSLLNGFLGFNTHSYLLRKYYDLDSEKNKKDANNSSILILILSFISVTIIIFFFGPELSNIFGLNNMQLYLAALASAFIFLINFRLVHWQVRRKVFKYTFLQFFLAISNLLITSIFLYFFFNGSQTRIDAYVLSAILTGLIAFILILKDNLLTFEIPSKDIFFDALKFGVPLIFHVTGSFLLISADRLVIKEVLSLSDVGVYMVAIQVSLVLNITFSAINKAYIPWLFELLPKKNNQINLKIVRLTLIYFGILIVIVFLGFFLAPIILKFIVGSCFKAAASLVGYIVLGQCFFGAYLMVTNYIFYVKKTHYLALITISCGIFNLLILYFMTTNYGLLGTAYSFIISMMIRFVATAIVSNRLYPMPWKNGILSLITRN